MYEVERTGPKPHPLDCPVCGRWWVVEFTGGIDWPPVPPLLGGESWPDPQPDGLCLACGAEYRDEGKYLRYTGRVVDDEELLLPGFAEIREMNRENGSYRRDESPNLATTKRYDDETVFRFDDENE